MTDHYRANLAILDEEFRKGFAESSGREWTGPTPYSSPPLDLAARPLSWWLGLQR